jgi:uncharacterized protein YndB with AHSA1/START domain
MINTGTLKLERINDTEVKMTRIFAAPAAEVYDAFRNPELLREWHGCDTWSLSTCHVDWRVGGGFRFLMQGPKGQKMGMNGRYVELDAPHRSVHQEWFDEWPGEYTVDAAFTEAEGKTTIVVRLKYPSKEFCDGMLGSGMEHGAAQCYDRLERVLDMRRKELVLTRLIDAPPSNVYRCWTEPELLKQWFAPLPYTTASADLDVRPGGTSSIVMKSPDGTLMPVPGVYLEVIPNQKLVTTDAFTSAWIPSAKPFLTVVLTFAEEDGKTRYTARCRHWTMEDKHAHEAMGFHEGWGICTDQLAKLAATLGPAAA